MATIIIEDGTIVDGANSYVTEAELITYASDRGIVLTSPTNELIIKAMDWLEQQSFIGRLVEEEQPLQWPRTEYQIDCYWKDIDYIPKELKNGLMALCINIDQGIDPLAVMERTTKREKVDVLEVEYTDSSVQRPVANSHLVALRKLLKSGGMGWSIRKSR